MARLVIGLLFGLTLGSAVAANPSAATEAVPQGPAVEKLMRDLDHENFWTREEASRELWKIGEKALPMLKELAKAKSPEQAMRARELIRKIELDVSPDSDPELIELVQSYPKSTASEKPKILNRLREIQAWRQMLRLYATESDQNILRMYAKSVHQIALFAARQQLQAGKPDAAKDLLELAPANAETLMALADFHRSQGTLNAELERNRNRPGKQAAAWRLALYRASGDLVSARHEAELADEPKIAAALAAMAGDPIPWLNLMVKNTSRGFDVVEQYYARMAIDHWYGERPNSQFLEKLKTLLDDRNTQMQSVARNALFLLAQNEIAERSLVKHNGIAAFWHFNSLERIDDALRILNLDAARLNDPDWVKKRIGSIEQLTFENEDQRNPKNELLALAAFMETRGMQQEAYDLFVAPLLELAVKDEDTFLEFLAQLKSGSGPNTNSPILAKKIGVQWAGEDPDKWISLVSALFEADELASNCWHWLPTLNPDASRKDCLDGLYALMGIGPDPQGLRGRWLAFAWKQLENAADDEKVKIRQKIAPLVIESSDVKECLRIWDGDAELRSQVQWGALVTHLSAAERWKEAAKIITDQIKLLENNDKYTSLEFHAFAAAALRNAGLNDEAKSHEELLDTLVLGDASLALQIGNGYAFGNDYQRAEFWWERSIRYANPESNQFVASALRYTDHALLDPNRWAQTAGLTEVICALLNSAEFRWENTPLAFMRQRMKSDLCRGLSLIKTDREQGLRMLDQLHATSITEGGLADFFFPAVRVAGLIDEHDRWFALTWNRMEEVLKRYPNASNTRNSTAWIAARAQRKIEPAEKYLTGTLALYPRQPAYLDTMAEIQFAKGDRKSAMDWSRKAILLSPDDKELRLQYEHFKKDPLPSKR